MLKYVDTQVTFAEVPDEITLCINISNCKFKCKGCHSPYLQEDVGEELTDEVLWELLLQNPGISCVCFMGGEVRDVLHCCEFVRLHDPDLKTAWYTGENEIPEEVKSHEDILFYIKVGPYIEEKGGLDNPNTNQRMYEIKYIGNGDFCYHDITYKFQKKEYEVKN